jgi:hypothetical protein
VGGRARIRAVVRWWCCWGWRGGCELVLRPGLVVLRGRLGGLGSRERARSAVGSLVFGGVAAVAISWWGARGSGLAPRCSHFARASGLVGEASRIGRGGLGDRRSWSDGGVEFGRHGRCCRAGRSVLSIWAGCARARPGTAQAPLALNSPGGEVHKRLVLRVGDGLLDDGVITMLGLD